VSKNAPKKLPGVTYQDRLKLLRQQTSMELEERVSFLAEKLCATFKITEDEFFNGSRTQKTVNMRWLLWKVLRDTGYSLTEIGHAVDRDHSTILHALKKDCPEGYEKLYTQLTTLNKRYTKENAQ